MVVDKTFSLPLTDNTSLPQLVHYETWELVLISVPLSALATWIIVSNGLVIFAVFGLRHMRTPSQFYIASLASTDFLVGLIILPPSILQIAYKQWTMGQPFCKTWLTLDVTLSTLSILHLIAIAVDRYRVISDGVVYLQKRRNLDVLLIVLFLWTISIWIATPPVLGWGDWTEIANSGVYDCNYLSTSGYVIHSAIGSFAFPMSLMIYFYFKIFVKIREGLKERASVPSLAMALDKEISETETSSNLLSNSKRKKSFGFREQAKSSSVHSRQIHEFVKKKIRFSLRKERRAFRTLGIIIGAFMICWMPFCIMYVLRPFIGDPPILVYHLLTWLGYLNSAINPIIYCVYNREYQQVFKRICCVFSKCRKKSRGNVRNQSTTARNTNNIISSRV